MASSVMTLSEKKIWGARWERARRRVIINARRRGVDLSKIEIVPDTDPNTGTAFYVAPWETVRQARRRERGA